MSLISSVVSIKSSVFRNVWQISKQYNCLNLNKLMPSVVCLDQKRCGFLNAKTVKRRKTYPFWWWPTVKRRPDVPFKDYISKDNKVFVDNYIKDKYENIESPLKDVNLNREEFTVGSKRCGLIAKKIGTYPMWTNTGRRILTTALQVVDNHVIKYHTPEEYQENCRPYHRHEYFAQFGVCIVGAQSADPRNFTAQYRGIFNESGVMPKNKLTRFFVTPNARLTPGTPLLATHFRVGDYVDIRGITRDHGFQGVVKRWNFRGQDRFRGVTKAHRRPGTIGRGRKWMGPWKGHKMAGHMGSERRIIRGLKIWRINTKYNVIWVNGPAVPGANQSWVYMFDTIAREKRHTAENPPPFPTFYAEDAKESLPEDIYDMELHAFNEPTIIFEETEAERRAALAAAKATKKAKTAKIR